MKIIKVTTATTLVYELLQRDPRLFLTPQQIRASLPQLNGNQISAALFHMHKRKAIDFVAQADGTFWFATPERDDRTTLVHERSPEKKPRNRKRKQPK